VAPEPSVDAVDKANAAQRGALVDDAADRALRSATSATAGAWALPPCNEPMPFVKDDRIVWLFLCAIKSELGASGGARLEELVAGMVLWSPLERAQASGGYVVGLASGVYDGVARAGKDLTDLVIGAGKDLESGLSGLSAAFDPQSWVRIRQVMSAEPGSDESRRAIAETIRVMGRDHPAFMESLTMAAAMSAAMRGLYRWVKFDPDAGAKIVGALSQELGKVIGEVASDFAQARTPYDVGTVLGKLIGTIFVEAARFRLGI
jgi:hypothetical protein